MTVRKIFHLTKPTVVLPVALPCVEPTQIVVPSIERTTRRFVLTDGQIRLVSCSHVIMRGSDCVYPLLNQLFCSFVEDRPPSTPVTQFPTRHGPGIAQFILQLANVYFQATVIFYFLTQIVY